MARDGCRNGVDHTLLANGLGENRGLFIQRLTLREEVAWLHAKATPEPRERSEWRRFTSLSMLRSCASVNPESAASAFRSMRREGRNAFSRAQIFASSSAIA